MAQADAQLLYLGYSQVRGPRVHLGAQGGCDMGLAGFFTHIEGVYIYIYIYLNKYIYGQGLEHTEEIHGGSTYTYLYIHMCVCVRMRVTTCIYIYILYTPFGPLLLFLISLRSKPQVPGNRWPGAKSFAKTPRPPIGAGRSARIWWSPCTCGRDPALTRNVCPLKDLLGLLAGLFKCNP